MKVTKDELSDLIEDKKDELGSWAKEHCRLAKDEIVRGLVSDEHIKIAKINMEKANVFISCLEELWAFRYLTTYRVEKENEANLLKVKIYKCSKCNNLFYVSSDEKLPSGCRRNCNAEFTCVDD